MHIVGFYNSLTTTNLTFSYVYNGWREIEEAKKALPKLFTICITVRFSIYIAP